MTPDQLAVERDRLLEMIGVGCPAGGDHDVQALEVIPAEGADHDVDGACIKCGADGFPFFIVAEFCECGTQLNYGGYCLVGCP